MLFTPAIAGIVLATSLGTLDSARAIATILAVLTAWICGYFAFFAFGLWFKSRHRRQEYLPALATYTAITIAAAGVALLLHPALWSWSIAFAPLVGLAVGEVLRRHPRSLMSGIATTVASTLLLPVMVTATSPAHPWELPAPVWAATTMLGGYFVSTIFFVKSVIRERNNPKFLRVSHRYHALATVACAVAAGLLATRGLFLVAGGLFLLTYVLAWRRAVVLPVRAQADPATHTPKRIGRGELPLTLLAALASCLCLI